MRRLLLVGAAMLMGNAWTNAAPVCAGSSDLVAVENWSITPIDDQYNTLAVTLVSHSDKAIRMIDGSVGFEDALGRGVASYTIDPDAAFAAGGAFSHDGRWGPYTFERLLKLKPSEVSTWVCVRSVLYDDGSKEQF